jgi:hypothetical protein
MDVKLGLTLREEHRLRMSENRMLRIIFGSMREEVVGCWGRLYNELHNYYGRDEECTQNFRCKTYRVETTEKS